MFRIIRSWFSDKQSKQQSRYNRVRELKARLEPLLKYHVLEKLQSSGDHVVCDSAGDEVRLIVDSNRFRVESYKNYKLVESYAAVSKGEAILMANELLF